MKVLLGANTFTVPHCICHHQLSRAVNGVSPKHLHTYSYPVGNANCPWGIAFDFWSAFFPVTEQHL